MARTTPRLHYQAVEENEDAKAAWFESSDDGRELKRCAGEHKRGGVFFHSEFLCISRVDSLHRWGAEEDEDDVAGDSTFDEARLGREEEKSHQLVRMKNL